MAHSVDFRRSSRMMAGSLLKIATERIHSRLSKAGDPLMVVPGSHVARNTALRGDDDAVADDRVADHTNLAGQDDVRTDGARSGETYLGAEQGILADKRSVANLNEVVDLRAGTDSCLSDSGAIDAGVCLDFDIVLQDGRSRLEDLVPGAALMTRAMLAGEAEAVSPDYGSILQQNIVRQGGRYSRTTAWAWAKNRSPTVTLGIKHDVRQDHGVVADS